MFSGSLNTDVCNKKQNLYDANNSNYLLSACLVSKDLTYSRSEAFCQANGMDLFDISSEESKTVLFDFAAKTFGEGSGAILHVKGRKSGECQQVSNEYGPFEASYGSCYKEFYLLCGFKNQTI
jgi:hypothetical protein